jgi:proline dehydrogenase
MSLINRLIVILLPLIPKPVVGLFSKPYIAGNCLDAAAECVKKLNARGVMATMDLLGESAHREQECRAAVEEYFRILERIDGEKLDCNISLKPTQLGLLFDAELCYRNIKDIVQKAREFDNFVRIDMEDSSCTSDTIEIYNRLREEFDNVGIVIQVYLRRSISDIHKLLEKNANLRLCKGIYIEPRDICYRDPEIVNSNFGYLIEKSLKAGSYVGIATHDEKVIWETLRIVDQLALDPEGYEFQMLLGVGEALCRILVDSGHRMRIYVPYGERWYAYSMRRLKENPKIAFYILKALLGVK